MTQARRRAKAKPSGCPRSINLRKSGDGMRFRDISDYLAQATGLPDAIGAIGQTHPAPGHTGR